MSSSAALYCRISSDPEGKEVGVANQEAAARELAARLGLTVKSVYTDNDVSASTHSRKPRPQYQAMIEAAKRGEFDVLVAYSNSRLTRRVSEYLDLIELHNTYGVEIRTVVSGDHNLATADGRGAALTVAVWDQAEAERTSERRAMGIASKLAQGIPLGRPRVFGYEADGMTPREDEAEILRAGYQHVLDGGTIRALTASWNKAGLVTLRGKAWSATGVRNALLRERNAGILSSRGQRYESSQIVPLIDMPTWEAVRAILTDTTRTTKGRPTGERWLSHAMTCECGRPMMVGSSWSRGKYSPGYQCEAIAMAVRSGVPREKGHAQIVAQTVEDGVRYELLALLIAEAVAGAADTTPESAEVVQLRQRLSEVQERRRAAQEAYLLPGADRAHLASVVERLGADYDATQVDLDAALSRRSAADLVSTLRNAVRRILDDQPADDEAAHRAIREAWESLSIDARRDMVRSKLLIVVAPGSPGVQGMDRVTITPLVKRG